MFEAVLFYLATSYVAWFIEQHEHTAVYPFDETHATPEAASAPNLTETVFQTDDGTPLIVWRAAPAPGHPTILYFSGNSGALKDRAFRFQEITARGYGIVAPAYRGSSGSGGKPDEALLMADATAIAADIGGPLVIYGESLGASVAIQLAAAGTGDALVLEAPFTSLPDLVEAQYPAEDLDHLITQRWNSLAAAGDVTQSALVVHGEDDRVVPFEMGETIFSAIGSDDKHFMRVTRQGHQGLWTIETQTTIFEFVNRFSE